MSEKKKPYANLMRRWLRSPWPIILALLFIAIYFLLGDIIKLILPHTKYAYLPGFTAEIGANYVRPDLVWPLPEMVDIKGTGKILIVPYYLVLGYLVALAHLLIKPYYKHIMLAGLALLLFLRVFPGTLLLFDSNEPSMSYGKPGNGSIDNSRRLAYKKHNYITYSYLGFLAGRTYVHEKVKDAIDDCYDILDEKYDRKFVIGESGKKAGGPISYHKEKQNGLQVDFMLPLNKDGDPYSSLWISNNWNYGIEFDENGRLDGMEIDYAVLANHIATLEQTCLKNDLTIKSIEMHPAIKKGLLGKNVAGLLKNIMGKGVRRDGKSSPAYYTVTFEIKSGKGRNLLNKIFGKDKKKESED